MSQPRKPLKTRAIQDTTMRRLRNTPSYFFLIWRWIFWLYALIVIIYFFNHNQGSLDPLYIKTAIVLLSVTFLQTLVVTLYAPIFQVFLPRLPFSYKLLSANKGWRRRLLVEEEETDILTPLVRTRNPYWDFIIYGTDILICGLIMYFGGPFGTPPFGNGSPFYRYGFSTIFAAALAYRYRGGLIAAFCYDLFVLLGIFLPAPGAILYRPNIVDLSGSLVDAPVVAILTAYVATLIANYAQSKKREQANVRRQRALLNVGETILREANDRKHLLQKAAEQLRQGSHFHRLLIAIISNGQPDTCIEVELPNTALLENSKAYLSQVLHTEKKLISFEYLNGSGIARLYLPFYKEGTITMIIGAETRRQTPFDRKQEHFLAIAGQQLLVALDNMRLTEQMIELAATAERGRIAREIHDGIAQLTYMLSLNAETCATQAHRIAEASEEDAELITPLTQRLDKLVTISKQALWETRNYMFSLKPMMSGTTTLTQMLTNQLREFETISDLTVHLEVEGEEKLATTDQHKHAQIGTAIFRIVQEALTNAYKHAGATEIRVHVHYLINSIEVSICDNGHGLPPTDQMNDGKHIYSGHGLKGMHERTEELAGTFEISQPQTGGVKVQIQIPV